MFVYESDLCRSVACASCTQLGTMTGQKSRTQGDRAYEWLGHTTAKVVTFTCIFDD